MSRVLTERVLMYSIIVIKKDWLTLVCFKVNDTIDLILDLTRDILL